MPSIPELIIAAAQRHGVVPQLAVEVGIKESNLNQAAISSAGAIGVMQLMPATARRLGVDPHKLEENIDGGVRYLKQQLSRFGDVAKALGAYNWGPASVSQAVSKWGEIWLDHAPAETQDYVRTILARIGSEWQERPVVNVAAMRRGVERFQQLDRSKQTVLMLAVIGLGLYALSEFWSE